MKVMLAQYFKQKEEEEAAIRQGYKELEKRSTYPAIAVNRVQLMHMLYAGGFDLEPLITDVENDLKRYCEFPMPKKAEIHIALAHFLRLPHNYNRHLDVIKEEVTQYLKNEALTDLESYYNTLDSNCVLLRCNILERMIDASAILNIHTKDQLQWINELQQLYTDNGLLLRQAKKKVDKVKYYCQQVNNGIFPTEEEITEMRESLRQALELSEKVPWPYLGNLLTDIACAYEFLNEPIMIRQIINRFDSLGLKENYCEYHRKQAMICLRRTYYAQ